MTTDGEALPGVLEGRGAAATALVSRALRVASAQASTNVPTPAVLAGLLALFALACGPQEAGPEPSGALEPKRGGVAVVAHRNDPPGAWELMRSGTVNLGHVSAPMTGDGNLLKPCRPDISQLCPGLAERWEHNGDFSEYTFIIRDKVLWHDGKPFTAEDAKFWFDLTYFGAKAGDKTRAPAGHARELGQVKETEVLEGNRLRVRLGGPDPLWALKLAQLGSGVGSGPIWHPKHLMQPYLDRGEVNVTPQDTGFVGTGPYKFLKYEKGSVVQVQRFEGYWEKDDEGRPLPNLEGVDYPIISDPTAMDAAFRTGRLDVSARGDGHYFIHERYDAMKNALGDRVWFGEMQGALSDYSFNVTRPGPLQDVRVRRAIALWVDKQASNEANVGKCCALPHPNVGPESIWPHPDWRTIYPGFNPATKQRDREEAKRLMAEAGYSNGFDVSVICRRQWLRFCEWTPGEFAGLGIRVQIDIRDDADYRAKELAGEFEIRNCCSPWSFNEDIGPELSEGNLARHSVNPLSSLKHEDPRIEEYFKRFKAAHGSLDERIRIWRELERYLLQEQVYSVPGWGDRSLVAFRSHVKGVHMPKRGRGNNMDMATVWLDK